MRTTWRDHRFVALVPASGGNNEGVVLMKTRICSTGGVPSLHVNAVTKGNNGRVRASLMVVGKNSTSSFVVKPLDGFDVDLSTSFVGDDTKGLITWRTKRTLEQGVVIALEIHLRRSRLYGYELLC